MKHISKTRFILKAVLLFFLISNMEILILSSNIKHYSFKNKITKKESYFMSHDEKKNGESQIYNHKHKRNIISFLQKYTAKNKKELHKARNIESASLHTAYQRKKRFTEKEIKDETNNGLKLENQKGEFFILGKALDKKFIVPDSTIRVFSSKLFESEYKDYNKEEIQKQKETGYSFLKEVKSGSIILGNNITLVYIFKKADSNKRLFGSILPNSKISYFPLLGSIDYPPGKFIIVFKGEGFIHDDFYFEGNKKIVTTTEEKIDYPMICSILTGNNTILQLDLSFKERNLETNKNYTENKKLSVSGIINMPFQESNDIKSLIHVIDPDTFPDPQDNCAVLFSSHLSNMNESTKTKTLTVCHKPNRRNSEYMIIGDKEENKIVYNNKLKGIEIKSSIVAHNTTLVIFEKYENIKGNRVIKATPLHEKISIINSKIEHTTNNETKEKFLIFRNYRYFEFLESGCFIIFSKSYYVYPLLSNCCSVKDLSRIDIKEDKTILRSILIGKNTAISIYTEPNYQGEMFTLYSSVEDYTFYSKKPISIGSIKIHNKECELNPDPKDPESDLQGCYYIYKEENRQGPRKLVCKKELKLFSKTFKTQFKVDDVEKEERFPVKSIELGNKNQVELLLSYKKYRFYWSDADNSYYFNQSIDKLPEIVMDKDKENEIRVFEILDPDCVVFFEKEDFLGKALKLCEDYPELKEEYKSILLSRNTEVALFEMINYQNFNDNDPIISIKESIKDLTKTKINIKKIKSIKFVNESSFTSTSEVYNSGYSIANFFVGTLESFFSEFAEKNETMSQRKKFHSCISNKEHFIKKEENKDTQLVDFNKDIEEYANANVSMLDSFMKDGKHILTTILKWYCNFKEWLISQLGKLASVLGWIEDPTVDSITDGDLKQDDVEKSLENNKSKIVGAITNTLAGYSGFSTGVLENANFEISTTAESDSIKESLGISTKKSRREETKTIKYSNKSSNEGISQIKYKKQRKAKANHTKNNNKLNPVRRKFRIQMTHKRRGFVDSIKKGARIVFDNAKEMFYNYVIQPIAKLGALIKNAFLKIKEFFNKYLNKFLKILKCSIFGGLKMFSLYNKLAFNIKLYSITMPIPIIGQIFLLDFVLSQLCLIDHYKLAIKSFKKGIAWGKANPGELNNVKWTYYGNAFGNVLLSISKTNSLASSTISSKNTIKDFID